MPAEDIRAALPAAAVQPPPIDVSLDQCVHQAVSHVHNKLAHLPIGFGVALALLLLIRRREDHFQAARLLAMTGTAAAWATVVAGFLQARALQEDAPQLASVLNIHRGLGLAAAVTYTLLAATWFPRLRLPRALRPLLVALLVAALLAAGLFGGWLSTSA